jgi:hypothetical protein
LVKQKSVGNDQYPKTIAEANNVLSNHRFDAATKKRMQNELTKNPPRKEMNHQNLRLLKWKGNVTFVEKDVINLPNVSIRTDQRHNGP